ncbi:hypothetical protein BXT84_00555 [Sulfobacillus thermotolerans]|uniref:Ribbon-helix-helix protein CopG domain-containing protein n=1 Tax=Sulfobacillus thermotolerans TaxID=338644 RepID=A0ABN5GWE3_9FIRM|nr:hypothetical protein BXT84_00555 [Sulfobacillus thermotolerans]
MSMKNNTSYPLRLPEDTWASVKQITQARGRAISDYIRDAVRLKLMVDGVGMNADTLAQLIQNANTSLTESVNFAAVHAAATLAFLREFAHTMFQEQGLPEHLAQEKAEVLADNALAEAVNTFENPQNRVQFGWIERFDDDTLALLEDDDGADE